MRAFRHDAIPRPPVAQAMRVSDEPHPLFRQRVLPRRVVRRRITAPAPTPATLQGKRAIVQISRFGAGGAPSPRPTPLERAEADVAGRQQREAVARVVVGDDGVGRGTCGRRWRRGEEKRAARHAYEIRPAAGMIGAYFSVILRRGLPPRRGIPPPIGGAGGDVAGGLVAVVVVFVGERSDGTQRHRSSRVAHPRRDGGCAPGPTRVLPPQGGIATQQKNTQTLSVDRRDVGGRMR